MPQRPTVSWAEVLDYWRRVRRRGRDDTVAWLREHLKALFGVGVVPVVVTWLVLWWFARAEAEGYLLTALAGLVAVLVVGFFVLIAKTHAAPARIAAERAADAEAERAALARRLLDEEATVVRLTALREPKLRLVELGHGGYLGALPYRVGVENLSDVPIHDVTLRLVESVPGADCLPAAYSGRVEHAFRAKPNTQTPRARRTPRSVATLVRSTSLASSRSSSLSAAIRR